MKEVWSVERKNMHRNPVASSVIIKKYLHPVREGSSSSSCTPSHPWVLESVLDWPHPDLWRWAALVRTQQYSHSFEPVSMKYLHHWAGGARCCQIYLKGRDEVQFYVIPRWVFVPRFGLLKCESARVRFLKHVDDRRPTLFFAATSSW